MATTPDPFRTTLDVLLRELLDGTAPDAAWVLNPGDRGLLASLEHLSASEASAPPAGGGASIAAHVRHLTYGLELLNRWSRGDDPWADADYAASWRAQSVTDDQWREVIDALEREAREWLTAMAAPRKIDEVAANGMTSSVVHFAYHLGAIRQINRGVAGPPA